jgi:hypothetical protein
MNKPASGKSRTHKYPLLALLAVFVAAALVALASRLLPSIFDRARSRRG